MFLFLSNFYNIYIRIYIILLAATCAPAVGVIYHRYALQIFSYVLCVVVVVGGHRIIIVICVCIWFRECLFWFLDPIYIMRIFCLCGFVLNGDLHIVFLYLVFIFVVVAMCWVNIYHMFTTTFKLVRISVFANRIFCVCVCKTCIFMP